MSVQTLKAELGNVANELDTLKATLDEENRDATTEEYASMKELFAKKKDINDKIALAEELEAHAETEPQTAAQAGVIVAGPAAEADPYSLGEYLQEIAASAKSVLSGGRAMPRVSNYQEKVRAAATGAGEAVPSDGGFLVGTDFADGIMKRAYDNNQVLSRCTRRTISGPSNKVEINGIDETSRADGSRHGGILSYWMAEAADFTGTTPSFRKVEIGLHDHGVLFYATNDLLQDTGLLGQEVEAAVSDEIAFTGQDAVINGSGAGKPQGILNATALVSQAAETGQVAATIVYENILKMLTRKWGSLSSYVWLCNQEIYPQLGLMNMAVGTGGAPVWLPNAGVAEAPYQVLMGRPLIEIEQAAALGTVGDLMLVDLSQYLLAEKGGIQSAMSIHVEFLSNQTVFRWITRLDGQSLWNGALTPYKGSATRSPFVALATRS